ncbi:MAG: hypothetical protein AB7I34_25400 [Rhizobiaceae bacterium]
MREGLKKAEQRFRGVGNVKIRELRCGQPIAASENEHTDVCPAAATGGGWPNAFHLPPGVIVTCPSFWNAMNNQFQDPEVRKDDAAMTLVHEVYHWLSIDDCPSRRVTCVKYVTDYHGDGAGGIPDRFWKGADRSRELARLSPRHATRNNDSYANFIRNVGTSQPYVHGIWEQRPGGSQGDYSHVHMLPWDSFVLHWESRGRDFELVDISTYVHFNTRLYSGLWHRSPGRNGALFYLTSWRAFEDKWRELQPTQELVDIEVFKDGDHLSYIGVWRVRDAGDRNVGAMFSGLTWDEFVARWQEVPKWQYLADIEAYHDVDGQLRFAGVWRARPDLSDATPNSLWRFNGMQAFADHFRQIASGNTLVDVERFYDNGQEVYVGIWRGGGNSGALWFMRDADMMSSQMRREDDTQLMTRLNFDLDLPMRMK